MKLSIILPIYNEEENIKELYREIKDVMTASSLDCEIIAVNDGSRDKSLDVLKSIAENDPNFKVINFWRNCGQTAALSAGIDHAEGEILIPMDADLQNDPADIPKILDKLEKEELDVVSGWRKKRKDKLSKKLPSKVANLLISFITKVKLHDYGCTLKAYRKEAIKEVKFYGEMHRYMPAYLAWQGAKIGETEVNHRPRRFGQAKYGLSRTFKVILDLLTVKFLVNYLNKPIHFFGQAGLICFFFGFVSGAAAIVLKFQGTNFSRTPLPLFTVFLIIVGVQFILMGLLAEILTRIYYEHQGKPSYSIKNKINFK